MNAALWISKTGMTAQDAKMNAISNNLANVDTVGFKRDRIVFEDVFYSILRQPGADENADNVLPTGVQLGNGVRVVGSEKLHTQGSVTTTDQDLDVAIIGSGFFQIEAPDGETVYTRNGQFHVNADGQIVNTAGLPLMPEVTVPDNAESISISTDGIVSAVISGEAEPEEIGEISIVTFMNPQGLEGLGGNLLAETEASGVPNELVAGEDGAGYLQQGSLEGSNVNVVEEMVDMISTQRAYEMNVKMVTAADEMLSTIVQAS